MFSFLILLSLDCKDLKFQKQSDFEHKKMFQILIFFSGWVVGSLEILGSPGTLAHALGSGIKDFVSMPFQGLLQGPWGFIVGITHGSASLMKHITAGM